MNLPPFSQTFYSSYHSGQGGHPSSASAPGAMHISHSMGYGSHVPMAAPGSQYHYPVTSPVAMSAPPLPGSHRQPPPHSYGESPRIPGGYSSSPGLHHLSPTSPTTHLAAPGLSASTGSTSSSSYPSAARTRVPSKKRRSGSASQSNESWEDREGRYVSVDSKGEGDEEGEDGTGEPWGMPQDEYKALNPRDKKQVRNR